MVYFRTVIRLQTASAAHDGLNRALFLSDGRRDPYAVVLRLTRL